jgi:hypothetical protein
MFLQGAITFGCDFIQYRNPQGWLPARILIQASTAGGGKIVLIALSVSCAVGSRTAISTV